MLGTSDGTFCPLSKLWCKSPQTEFFGLERERFFVQSRAEESPIALALGIFITIGLVGIIMLGVVAIWPGDTFMTQPWAAPTGRFLWLTLFQAVGAVFAVPLIAQAYRIGNPAVVAVFEYSFLIFASLWTFLLWGITSNPLTWVGIIVILISGSLMAITQKRTSDAATSL